MLELAVYTPHKIAGEALCRLLQRRHLQPRYFQDMEELLEKVRMGETAAIILDLSSVPQTSEEIENIRLLSEEIPVIMATPYGSEDRELEHFQQKGYHLLEKPIHLPELLKIIRSLTSE